MSKFRFRHSFVAFMLLVSMLVQGTWALAGTTGNLSGVVTDNNGAPLANAKVSVVSPSQTGSTTTDASGHFVFLSLAPDAYTVAVEKQGYDPISVAGVNVFTDQTQNLTLRTQRTIREIGRVTSRAASDIVKPGTTADVYSVNAATTEKIQSVGGGSNLNNAYSGMLSVPGVYIAANNAGWGQTTFIRGADYTQVGYEYDGIPVNRAFDNYNANTLSTLGQQELQVYTGGSPAGSSSETVGGFINQVIRSGTYPGFASLTLGVGSPTFYHQAQLEVGGATPNRNFSYYFGLLGYNQDFRHGSNFGGQSLPGLLGSTTYNTTGFYNGGVYPTCVNGGDPFQLKPGTPGYIPTGTGGDAPGCYAFTAPFEVGALANLSDREAVANFHIGIPHRNDGGKDDIQLLYSGSYLHEQAYNSLNDIGGQAALQGILGFNPTLTYRDGYTFPLGTQFGTVVTPGSITAVPYYFPSSPSGRPFKAAVPVDLRDAQENDSEIGKIQYQKNIGSSQYVRIFGYTFYSDWLLNSPMYASIQGAGSNVGWSLYGINPGPDYELNTHTRGAELQYANQINSKNLLTFTGNYTTATVTRFNNRTYGNGLTTAATNLVDSSGNCYNYKTGVQGACDSSTTRGTFGDPTRGNAIASLPAGSPATTVAGGVQWLVTNPGEVGTFNTVKPVFTSYSLTDQWKPTDKWLINAGLRYEQYQYNLPTTNTPAMNFWFRAAQQDMCYYPSTGQPAFGFLGPNTPPPAPLVISLTCPVSPTGEQSVHPDGLNGHVLYTNVVPGNITRSVLEPRIATTFTLDPYTVIRAAYGRYAQPVQTAYTEYLNKQAGGSSAGANQFNFANFFGYGYNNPRHDLDPSVSDNVDLSLEKQLKGTDLSFKLSPFFRYTKNQYQTLLIGPSFASGLPAGNQTSEGIEFQIKKGDPSRDGWSGQLSYTYTYAFVKYKNLANGTNQIDSLNNFISAYNALTSAGGGAPCYNGTSGLAYAGCTVSGNQITMDAPGLASGMVINPYYFKGAQPLLNRGSAYPAYDQFPGWATGSTSTIVWPHLFSGFVNYKHKKWSFSPNFLLQAGNNYGSPVDVIGLDPRSCTANQSTVPTAPNAGLPNWTSCGPSGVSPVGLFIPNPETGRFDALGEFRQPWVLNVNAQMTYDFTPKTRATLILSNIFNRCYGGSKTTWSSAFPANSVVCGYNDPNIYVSNFYNGSSPFDVAANGVSPLPQTLHPFSPTTQPFFPFNAYLQFQFKI